MSPDSGRVHVNNVIDVDDGIGRRSVSIIITNYNYARYVGAALDSALAQTHAGCEIIVVDDGSKDDSRTVLQAYRDRPGVRLIFQDNAGQAAAFNTGFAAASGDFILFLDADDLLHPDAVATVLSQWTPGLSRCQFPLQIVDPEGRGLGLHPFSHKMDDGDLHWKIAVSGHMRFIPTSGNVFARAALAPLFPIPADEWRLCADSYIAYRTAAAGPVVNISEALGCYRVHDSNNWYREGRDRDQLQQVWRQIFQLWRSMLDGLTPHVAPGREKLARRNGDQAALYLYRRLIAGYISVGGLLSTGELRRLLRAARLKALTAALPWRQRLLYLACFLLAGGKGWRFAEAGRWNAHHSLRPAWLARLIERWKGAGFNDWQSAVAPPEPVPEFPLDETIEFGRGRDGNRHLWYGWEQGDPLKAAASGHIAAIAGRLPPGGGDVAIELALTPVTHAAVPWQRLAIDANGTRIYEGRHFQPATLRLSVPRAVARKDDKLVLQFSMPDVFVPRLVADTPSDFRPQGYVLSTLKVSSSVSEAGDAAGMYLPVGRRAAAAELQAAGALKRGWHEPDAAGIARISSAEAQLSLTLLDGAAFDHVLELEFAVEDSTARSGATVEVSAAGELLGIADVTRQGTSRVLLPPSLVSEFGAAVISLVPSGLWQDGEDWPAGWPQAAGPGLRSVKLERWPRLAQHPVYRSGLVLNFDSGGTGIPFRESGWHKPNGQGSLTADAVAVLEGLWLDRQNDVFLTAVVYPALQHPDLPPQQLTVVCNGCTVAIYSVAEMAEITAVIPPGIVAGDGTLRIEFRVTRLLRPADYGRGDDNRLVGVGLRLLSLE